MNETGQASESAQPAIAADLTDLAFREPGRHFFCELHLHPQLGDRGLIIPGPGPQPGQLGPLGLTQRRIRILPGLRGSSCHFHPLAQNSIPVDADVTGDLSDRTAAVNDESYRLLLVLRRKCAACRTHFSLSRQIGQLSRVSTEAGTVQTATSRHTVLLDPAAVDEGVLGTDKTVADARSFVRDALGTSSLATLNHAKAFAEQRRH